MLASTYRGGGLRVCMACNMAMLSMNGKAGITMHINSDSLERNPTGINYLRSNKLRFNVD